MTTRISAPLLLFLVLLPCARTRADLRPGTKDRPIPAEVGERLCYAGRLRVDRLEQGNAFAFGRFVERMPSGEGHPNDVDLGEVRIVLRGNVGFTPEAGKTYCLILTAGSKQGLTVVAHGPDDAATAAETRRVIGSPSAFENDATWRKRRALWAGFRKDAGPGGAIAVYGEDDAFRNILYVKADSRGPFPLHLYDAGARKSEPVVHAKVLPGVNRITYEKGYFHVWFNGSVELSVGTRGED
jgi:hypothetical protein